MLKKLFWAHALILSTEHNASLFLVMAQIFKSTCTNSISNAVNTLSPNSLNYPSNKHLGPFILCKYGSMKLNKYNFLM